MDKKDKKVQKRILKVTCVLIIMTFLTLYFSQVTGYYEYSQYKKVTFTREQIEQFEKDVSDGKNIDIKNYMENPNKDYTNKMSRLGYELSNGISNGVKGGIEGIFKLLNKVVEE